MSLILTNAVGTGMLAIALGPELVALITRPADSPSDRASSPSSSRSRPIGVLAMLRLGPCPSEMWVVNSYMLLELLESVVRPLGEGVESRVQVPVWDVPVRQECC